jgi:hypothetical protein
VPPSCLGVMFQPKREGSVVAGQNMNYDFQQRKSRQRDLFNNS